MTIRQLICKLPVNSDKKIRLQGFVQRIYWFLHYDKKRRNELINNQVLLNSNHYYGHEYWLKKYCGYDHRIGGIIEHGVYFGNNRDRVGPSEDWDTGSILTFGESRVSLLKELYPSYNIYPIGPRIHYADISQTYYDEIYRKLDHTGKTLTIYPSHSIANEKAKFDSKLFLEEAKQLAKRIGAKNILVSLHPSDYLHNINLDFEGANVILVGGGNNPLEFLPRIKAIFKLSDLTFSNSLGTHVGYSIYMKTPHVMSLSSNKNAGNPVYECEQKKFAEVFNGVDLYSISEEQYALCDYYFGYSYIRKPSDLQIILDECRAKYYELYGKRI